MKNIGKTIKRIRKAKGLSQKELASKSGISQTYLSQIENSSRDGSIQTLSKISKALDLPMAIVSFLSLSIEDVEENKRGTYPIIVDTIKVMAEKFFTIETTKQFTKQP